MTPADYRRQLLGAVHGDQESLLREQLRKIEAQKAERERLSNVFLESMREDLLRLGTLLLQLTPEPSTAETPDVRHDRLSLERDRQTLAREGRDERRSCWLDQQTLEEEQRQLEKELTGHAKRRARLEDLLQ